MERTYVFNQDGNNGNGGGSKFDIMAMLPNLMGSKGVDPGLLALLNQGRGSQDQWGGSWWFIWIILLWFCWGGNGFGNRFGNGGGLPAELNGDVGREYLMSAIQGNGNAINQLASSLNCSTQQLQSALCNIQGLIANVGNQVGMSSQQIINAFQSGNQAVLTQIADCCCKTQNAITTMAMRTSLQCAIRPTRLSTQPIRMPFHCVTVRPPNQCYPCEAGRHAEPGIAGQDCGSYSRKSHFDC